MYPQLMSRNNEQINSIFWIKCIMTNLFFGGCMHSEPKYSASCRSVNIYIIVYIGIHIGIIITNTTGVLDVLLALFTTANHRLPCTSCIYVQRL